MFLPDEDEILKKKKAAENKKQLYKSRFLGYLNGPPNDKEKTRI